MALFWTAFVLLFCAYAARVALELLLPFMVLIVPLSVIFIIGGGVWLYLKWRDSQWY